MNALKFQVFLYDEVNIYLYSHYTTFYFYKEYDIVILEFIDRGAKNEEMCCILF